MLTSLKKYLYFPVASYFRFFASLKLRRWSPKVIVVTGSSGKTTLLHLIESQMGNKARYSHHANSSFGIPFDILNLHRTNFKIYELIKLLIAAPINTFKSTYPQKYYVVEADCDRPGEGKFLASLLKPNITLWLNSAKTHSQNFDPLSEDGVGVDELIAYEFGYFLKYCKDLIIINSDNSLQIKQISRAVKNINVEKVSIKQLIKYEVNINKCVFKAQKNTYIVKQLLPKVTFYSLRMTQVLIDYLKLPFDSGFENYISPPGRATLLTGINKTVIIDSSYNANLASMKAILLMFDKLPLSNKWVVLGDMLELGNAEKSEHEELADIINSMDIKKAILIGKLLITYTKPKINNRVETNCFKKAPDAKPFILENIKGNETILFKGSQSILLEGIIEELLLNKKDKTKLPRQSGFWKNWRKKHGFN